MKKFVILGAFICSFAVSFAQPAKISKEEARFICAEIMANFTESLEPFYKKGMAFDDFRNGLLGDVKPSKEATGLLMNSFDMLVNKTERDVILRMYQGTEVAQALQFMYDLHQKGITSDGSEFFGLNTDDKREAAPDGKCKWYEFFCHVRDFSNWVIDNWSTISQIIIFIVTTF